MISTGFNGNAVQAHCHAKTPLKWKIFLLCAVCYAGFINLETSPFRYFALSKPFSACLNNQLLVGDNYVYLYTGSLILKGKMPYLHSFDHKGPLLYLLVALGIKIGNLAGVWLLQFCFLSVSAFFAYKTARMLVTQSAVAISASLAVLWYSRIFLSPESLSVPFLLVSFYYFVRFLTNGYRISLKETFLVGFCFGAVALLKLNLTGLWIFFIILFILASVSKKEYMPLLSHSTAFLTGSALVAIPILAWLYARGAFPDFIKDYWVFNVYQYGETPSLPVYLGYFLPLRQPTLRPFDWLSFYWYNTPTLLFLALMIIRKGAKSTKLLYTALILYFVLSILLIGMSGRIYSHYCTPLITVYLVVFAVSVEFTLRLTAKRKAVSVLLFLLLTAPALPSFCFPAVKDRLIRQLIRHYAPDTDLAQYGYPFRTDRDDLDLASWLAKNTSEETTITGVGFRVYWYADRVCASQFSFDPARHSYEDTFVRDSEGNYPEIVFEKRKKYSTLRTIITPPPTEQTEVKTSPEIEKTLADKYKRVYRNDSYDVYQIRDDRINGETALKR